MDYTCTCGLTATATMYMYTATNMIAHGWTCSQIDKYMCSVHNKHQNIQCTCTHFLPREISNFKFVCF